MASPKWEFVGLFAQIDALKVLGAAAASVNGPVASIGSTGPPGKAGAIETGIRYGRPWRRAGPAHMFKNGIAETMADVPTLLLPAIAKSVQAVSQAKGAIRKRAIDNVRKRTPVRSGALRTSISEMSRPGQEYK
jgi:hypothetical protein